MRENFKYIFKEGIIITFSYQKNEKKVSINFSEYNVMQENGDKTNKFCVIN